MRGRTLILTAMLSAAVVLPDVATAQFSPRGIIGGVAGPLRHMFRQFGHYPRHRSHRRAPGAAQRMPNPAPSKAWAANTSQLGWVGPAAWPGAYEDLLGFTFAPADYAPQLRGRGFDVIADTITGHFEMTRAPTRAATTGAAVRNDADDRPDACRDTPGTQENWPAARIEQTATLSDTQHQALDRLQAAVMQAAKAIKADCRDSAALAAPDRLSVLVHAIWSVREAGTAVRAPLKSFHDTLTEAQQVSFVSQQPQPTPSADAKPDAKPANNDQNRQYQACAAQNVAAAERMIKEIEQRVRPNKAQAASLEALHKVSSNMAKLLMASCAQPIPPDPLARLDAADHQLTAMNYAATTMQIAFNSFYAKLDDGQKARLNALGR